MKKYILILITMFTVFAVAERLRTESNSSSELNIVEASIANIKRAEDYSSGLEKTLIYQNGMQYMIIQNDKGGLYVVNITKDKLEVNKLNK